MDKSLQKKTDELIKELKNKNIDLEQYIAENEGSFLEINLLDFWSSAIKKSGLSNSNIINRAEIAYYYFYEVINGKKIPSKDKIVALSLAMNLTLEECQDALRFCGRSALYPKFERDSILIYAVTHGLSVIETNKMLDRKGLPRI